MPIRPELRHFYGPAWRAASLRIRQDRAGWRCEVPHCAAQHGLPHPITSSRVVLTVAHLDHDPANGADGNLLAMCQRCHLHHDRHQHRRSAAATRRRRLGTLDLFDDRDRYLPPLLAFIAPGIARPPLPVSPPMLPPARPFVVHVSSQEPLPLPLGSTSTGV